MLASPPRAEVTRTVSGRLGWGREPIQTLVEMQRHANECTGTQRRTPSQSVASKEPRLGRSLYQLFTYRKRPPLRPDLKPGSNHSGIGYTPLASSPGILGRFCGARGPDSPPHRTFPAPCTLPLVIVPRQGKLEDSGATNCQPPFSLWLFLLPPAASTRLFCPAERAQAAASSVGPLRLPGPGRVPRPGPNVGCWPERGAYTHSDQSAFRRPERKLWARRERGQVASSSGQ